MKENAGFRLLEINEKILVLIAAAGFAVGTTTHTVELILGGWLPYASAELWKNVYWTALTFLDPLVIALLFIRLKPAFLLANFVIVSDVIINTRFLTFFCSLPNNHAMCFLPVYNYNHNYFFF